ncbi:MAG: hypothetical protein H0T88_08545 [Lysobacter sp.]|nr:hypothetical protein [Lysobacter sp.]
MKAVATGVFSVALLALASCASMDSRSDRMAPQARAMTAEEMYVAYVERNAARRGIELIWVHKPKIKETLAQQ